MPNDDLLKWVTSDVDFYELMGITPETCSESELRRAYRKTALKYHPDKVGKDFDPAKYELFQAANEVLGDAELRAKYDNARNAKLQKQRANELFEGKRRQMKEDLEARERGVKRPRQNEAENEAALELRRMAEEGKKRRMMAENRKAQAAASVTSPVPEDAVPTPPPAAEEQAQEDEVERLERKIREAEQAKAKRKAEKKARKSGVYVAAESPVVGEGSKLADRDTVTPIKRPDIFRGLKADEKSSASPKFSFSPKVNTPQRNDFAATMARLKAAEKQRLEDEIRQQEESTAT